MEIGWPAGPWRRFLSTFLELLAFIHISHQHPEAANPSQYLHPISLSKSYIYRGQMAQQAQDGIDPSALKTPERCVADFCLIPVRCGPPPSRTFCGPFSSIVPNQKVKYKLQIGTPTASVSHQIADVQRLMQKSSLKYSMHSAGTTVGK